MNKTVSEEGSDPHVYDGDKATGPYLLEDVWAAMRGPRRVQKGSEESDFSPTTPSK